ncbi:MAG: ATP-dependent DNA helicase [Propionibacteriaceae bacterium]
MADAVADALRTGCHLLVQAGTGTGKSLGYLAPVLTSLQDGSVDRVVIATATLALQHQLAEKDIPAALEAVHAATKKRPSHAVLKGRTNYACLLRVRDGVGDRDQGALFGADQLAATIPSSSSTRVAEPESALAAEVLALREWVEQQAEEHALADRDHAPTHTERGWAQVSIPVRECLGAQRCPWGEECFVERSREVARGADLVVTNHALLAIDAMHGGTALPDHDAVVIDEAHELVARVTGAASAELTPQGVERVGKRAAPHLQDDLALDLLEAADELRLALDAAPLERVEHDDAAVVAACAAVRGVTRQAVSALGGASGDDPERRQVAAAMKEVFDIAERMARLADVDVVWVSDNERTGRTLQVAPLTVAGLLRNQVFADRTVVLTSATLKLGGDFDAVAGSFGLRVAERDDSTTSGHGKPKRHASQSGGDGADLTGQGPAKNKDPELPWRGLDVGSPFDYRRQGIRYVARDMDRPGRDGISEATLTEVAELVWAAGGRTLGLFSSRRAAEAAARHVRRQLPKLTVLCQGDAQLSELTRRFVAEETTSLFGTLSLWQGVDVPGATCSLVIIDRIPFPRPDEPLTVARQRAVAESGGNGFMAVAATHAALLLAQGAGRLIRRTDDRGVVAVLDPRLVTARYGSFLQQSMPPMWPTTDREVAVGALRRLAGAEPG